MKPSPALPSVRHYLPGGREQGGGIGRLVGYIVDAQPGTSRHEIQDTRGPEWNALSSGGKMASAMATLARDRARTPDMIHHIHVAGRGSTARKLILTSAARHMGARHVLHLHDYDYRADYLARPGWQQAAVRAMFQGADKVIVLGAGDRDLVRDLLRVPPERIAIAYNCVPDPGPRPARPGGDAPVHILFLGQLGPRKGTPELLSALAHPGMAGRSWRATIAGNGPVADYREMAVTLGLGDRVYMPGWVSEAEVRSLCQAADILVLPSHAEGFAMAVLEGLSHGLAVITTRVGAHEDLLRHDDTCVFVPVGEPAALASAMAGLIDHPAHRQRIGAAGRDLFLSRLDIRSYATRLADIYAGLGSPALVPEGAA
ncbi:glycosyltransferase family 4 protein [Pseudooceanicola sp. LIPI14-2-Ac024]|uniref:glycosyltransferase family 4 protein n=1 Tax=Pseudooceanicola sp. LIPI14-2-Ac024 TaxID=3344875 RepID=UPI0035D073E7